VETHGSFFKSSIDTRDLAGANIVLQHVLNSVDVTMADENVIGDCTCCVVDKDINKY
jgi:hypothetical protein